MINLPFKLELNAPINKVLKSTLEPVNYKKELVFAVNRIYRQKIRNAFTSIKTSQLNSPASYFKFVLASLKQSKKENRISYPTYNPQLPPTQPHVPKTPIFNNRVKAIKNSIFLKLKQFALDARTSQLSTVVNNRQNELLNHFVPKIQEKIYAIVFRAIADYARDKKGKCKIVKLMDKLEKNVVKRVYFSEFMGKLLSIQSKEGRKKLACQKMIKILKLSQRYIGQSVVRKLQSYQQFLNLQEKQAQKKERISKIHQVNSERTVTIQKQRQALRNLKYKLDQESIEKNHVMTEKRRSLMLARTKFAEQTKQLTQQSSVVSAQVHRLTKILQKQSHILTTIQTNRNNLNELKRHGINFQSITLTVYKAIYDVGEEGLNGFMEIVKHHEEKWNHVEGMVLLETIQGRRDFQARMIVFLERVLKGFERREGQSEFNGSGSRFKPLGSTASTSQLKVSPSASSLKGSRVVNGQYNPKTRSYPDPAQLIRLKEQYTCIQSFIGLVLSKSYELKIKQAIAAQIEQLSELLASDLKENEG